MRPDKQQAMTTRAAVFIDVAEAVGLLALVVFGLLALAVAIVPAAERPATVPAAGEPAAVQDSLADPVAAPFDSFAVTADTSLVFVIQLGSRLYPEWKETRQVRLQERFIIGDTENVAVLTTLLPDFRIAEGGPRSVSPNLANPAVRVYVYRGEARTDSAWAFLNFPPHYSAKSFFTFQLKEIVGYPAPAADVAPAAAAPAAAPTPKLEGE
jgi:hypothetical protein